MAKGEQWEVVGGAKAKKPKSKSSKTLKSNGNGTPSAFAPSAPIKESTTIYAALQEKREAPPPKVTDSPRGAPSKKKNKAQDKKPPQRATLEETIASINEEDLKSHLATLEVLCPGSSLIWLKELASFLNAQVDVPVEDPAFASKPIGYPANLLSKAVSSNINKLLAKCPTQMQQIFYEFCLQSLVQDTLKGLNTMGYRLMLQILANTNSSIVLSSLNKCSELCVSHQNRQNICLSVLWGAGQAGNKNLEAGIKVWLDLMFPLISSKNCTAYVVDYIERLTKMTEAVGKCSKSLVDVRDFFPILDFVHSRDIGKNTQKRMVALYPTIKNLSYGPEPETSLRNYFPSYLRRLEPQCPQPMKEEILSSLLLCLEKDQRCYSIWRQLYTKHLVQSKQLISHLNDQWDQGCSKRMPRRLLRDTLATFQVTNEELLASGKKELKELVLINKELLSKIDAGSFSWPRLVLILILIISSALTFDILVHGTFAESVSGKLMKDYGLLLVLTQAGEKLGYFYGRVQTLFEQYYPPAYNWLRRSFSPLVDSLFSKTCSAAVVVWDATHGMRTWCGSVLPPLLAKAEQLFVTYGTSLQSFLKSFAVIVSKQFLGALVFVLDSVESAAVWLQTSPQVMDALATAKQVSAALAENVQKNAVYLFETVKAYVPLPA